VRLFADVVLAQGTPESFVINLEFEPEIGMSIHGRSRPDECGGR
jgi:hypothetical protein